MSLINQHITQTEAIVDDTRRPAVNASQREVIAWALYKARRKGDRKLVKFWKQQQAKLKGGNDE